MKVKSTFYKYVVPLALCVSAILGMNAAPVSIRAKLDSASMLMGNVCRMRVEVVQNKGDKGYFPLLQQAQSLGYVSVCGDSVELRVPSAIDTVELGSRRIQINFEIPVQSFDSGYYKLPELAYVIGKDTTYSSQLSLRVNPVKATADDEISPLAGVVEPEGKSWTDMLPDWLVDWWWLYVLLIVLSVVVYFTYRKFRDTADIVIYKKKELPKPWIVALQRLNDLKARKLWENGQEKEYFTELTDILRVYLNERYNINAVEMTSREIMDTLRKNKEISDKRDYVRQILDIADFVKFAKVRPLPDDNTQAFDNAVSFINLTVPKPSQET